MFHLPAQHQTSAAAAPAQILSPVSREERRVSAEAAIAKFARDTQEWWERERLVQDQWQDRRDQERDYFNYSED